MKLSELMKGVRCKKLESTNEDADIKGIAFNSKEVKEGDVFVCICGSSDDGNRYVKEAAAKSAAAVVTENDIADLGIPTVTVPDSREALAVMSANFYGRPADKLKLIGVTGTNGKTSITYLLKNILESAGYKTGIIGTNRNIIGNMELKAERTTPDALAINKMFAEMAEQKTDYAIMEVSSHSLIQKRVYGLNFEIGILTNITRDHLDYHKTMEEYARAKSILFENSKISVLNRDDEYFEFIKERARGDIYTYGTEASGADFTARGIRVNENKIAFAAYEQDKKIKLEIPLSGRFYVYNALAAYSAARLLGIPSAVIKQSLKSQEVIKGRMERVPGTDAAVIIDYAHTPDGLLKVLSTINEFKKGRLVTVFGCGGDRDKSKRAEMGRIASELSDFVIVTSDNPRTEDPSAIIGDIVKGIEKNNYIAIENRKKAIFYGLSLVKSRDILLLAGKGHETYQILKDRVIDFDEREVIKEYYAND